MLSVLADVGFPMPAALAFCAVGLGDFDAQIPIFCAHLKLRDVQQFAKRRYVALHGRQLSLGPAENDASFQ